MKMIEIGNWKEIINEIVSRCEIFKDNIDDTDWEAQHAHLLTPTKPKNKSSFNSHFHQNPCMKSRSTMPRATKATILVPWAKGPKKFSGEAYNKTFFILAHKNKVHLFLPSSKQSHKTKPETLHVSYPNFDNLNPIKLQSFP